MDFKGLRVTKNTYFSFLTLTKLLLFAILYYRTAGVGSVRGCDTDAYGMTYGRIDVKIEICM